jgi:hypothetical protein
MKITLKLKETTKKKELKPRREKDLIVRKKK